MKKFEFQEFRKVHTTTTDPNTPAFHLLVIQTANPLTVNIHAGSLCKTRFLF